MSQNQGGRVLIVEDDNAMSNMVKEMLVPRGIEIVFADLKRDIIEQVDAADVDVVLTDLRMPGVDGNTICERVSQARPDVPVIVMTGFGSLASAVAALRAGAWDFVTKPIDQAPFIAALTRAVKHRHLSVEVKRLRKNSGGDTGEIGGSSEGIHRVRELIAQVADLDVPVLVTGEAGTGKELVARALHRSSRRVEGPFVVVHCAAVPAEHLEEQLFGERGAWTQAAGGTLFIDEIGDLPKPLQPKLLQALQERTRAMLASSQSTSTSTAPKVARPDGVVVATDKDLEDLIHEGAFREDLASRLNVVHVHLPPLRARGDDLLRLAQRFVSEAATRMQRPVQGLSPAAAAALSAYPWPGNVRELQNAMERAVALARYDQIGVDDLPEKVTRPQRPSPMPAPELLSLDEVERRHVVGVFEAMGGNRRKTTEVLGIDPKTLYRKLLSWGITSRHE
jgi:DNA-binding NtrC family response regulator